MKITVAFALLAALSAHGLYVPLTQPSNSQHPLQDLSLDEVPVGFNIDLDALRLVQFSENERPVWITEREKIEARARGHKFFDITDTPNLGPRPLSATVKKGAFPPPSSKHAVKSVISTLSTDGPRKNLEKFTSFRTRYYRSSTGRDSQLWLLGQIQDLTAKTASAELRDLISISEFKHSWGQNSIITRIKGSSKAADSETVIISAHQDSTNMFPFLAAPGADDDGSGTVTILETYRGLLASNFTPVNDVEFHWYSAEEGGLLGSQAVAKEYRAQGAKVKAQLQFDMTAWVKAGTREEIGVITDFVDAGVTDYVKTLIDTYIDIPYVETKCGYACSDHASWTKAGYPSAFSIESSFENSNKNIHSTNDRIDISPEFSFDHMLHFSKLAAAFAIELGGWKH
jgi:leucyl aminopeptidase